MHIEALRDYLLSLKGAEESFPFDEHTLVFKVGGKMFALVPLEKSPLSINLKCEPELAIELRERYDCIQGGYHMNKKHWNTICINGEIEREILLKQIDNSYQLVFSKLPKKLRETINHS